MILEKIFDYKSELFLELKKGRYFVFEKYIVFKKGVNIYAMPHFRRNGMNVVDSFEQEYKYLCLKYKFSGDLSRKWVEEIRKQLELLEKR